MNTKPNFELLKDAYAIVGGIPEDVIDLFTIQESQGESLSCGTVCCAIGWLGHHPKFQALGLRTDKRARASLTMHGSGRYFEDAAAELFNISTKDAVDLFGTRGHSRYDDEVNGSFRPSDKALWMYRMRKFLREHGQLKHQLAKRGNAT